ncbi:MAG: hypothetical protein HY904_00455 [Deltaproteobacteria bacterium]|nr:hypothetical protein [Deltaproteobacteria bacterium]
MTHAAQQTGETGACQIAAVPALSYSERYRHQAADTRTSFLKNAREGEQFTTSSVAIRARRTRRRHATSDPHDSGYRQQ